VELVERMCAGGPVFGKPRELFLFTFPSDVILPVFPEDPQVPFYIIYNLLPFSSLLLDAIHLA